jgi:hypothetical protein
MEVLSICPPVRANVPVAELLLDGTAMLKSAMLPFSANCRVNVRFVPAAPTTVAVATAKLSKQLSPIVKFRFETLTDAVGVLIVVITLSVMLKLKLSIGEGIPAFIPLIVGVTVALQFPVRLLFVPGTGLLEFVPLGPNVKRLLPIPQPDSQSTNIADAIRNNRMLRID